MIAKYVNVRPYEITLNLAGGKMLRVKANGMIMGEDSVLSPFVGLLRRVDDISGVSAISNSTPIADGSEIKSEPMAKAFKDLAENLTNVSRTDNNLFTPATPMTHSDNGNVVINEPTVRREPTLEDSERYKFQNMTKEGVIKLLLEKYNVHLAPEEIESSNKWDLLKIYKTYESGLAK